MLDNIRLNNAPASLFTTKNGTEREDLVVGGRLLTYESNGRATNRVRALSGLLKNDFESKMDDITYRTMNEKYRQKLMLFAAKTADAQIGQSGPADYSEFIKMQRKYASNSTFLKVLAGISEEVITPLLPYVTSNALGALAKTVSVPFGQTYEVTVGSNDYFVFQDSSWGASRSVPSNYMYDRPITLNPTPKTAKATMKWYQLVGNDQDIGMFFNGLLRGMYNKILALWNAGMTSAAANSFYTPSYLQFASYNTTNWVSCAKRVSEANGVPRESLMAFGDFAALNKVLPSGTSQDASLTFMLGGEWNYRGYLGTVLGVKSYELTNAFVPGTQNTTGTELLPTNVIYMTAMAGDGYAPMYIAMEDGTPITIELDPTNTADMTIDVNVTVTVDVAAVFAKKVGVISNV